MLSLCPRRKDMLTLRVNLATGLVEHRASLVPNVAILVVVEGAPLAIVLIAIVLLLEIELVVVAVVDSDGAADPSRRRDNLRLD